MKGLHRLLLAGVVLTSGCASTAPPPEHAVDCRVARATGDVAMVLRSSGELVIVGGGLDLLRSDDLGQSFRRQRLPIRCRWPGLAESGGRLVVSCSDPRAPSRLMVMLEETASSWTAPVIVDHTPERFIDSNLQAIDDQRLLLFATHVGSDSGIDGARFEIRVYTSADRGRTWSDPAVVVAESGGERLEDTRSVVLANGTVLAAHELETLEGAPSRLRQQRSADGGATWSAPEVVWGGADLEPGGYVQPADNELWLVASSDGPAGGGSYDRATILLRRSTDGGRTWSEEEAVVDQENQISFGGVALPGGDVLLPSLRFYSDRARRELALYAVDGNRKLLGCGSKIVRR